MRRGIRSPFNPVTRIGFDLPEAQVARLRVYDVSGRLVRTLIAGEAYPAGSHSVLWNGEDNRGQAAASGVYLCRLSTAKHTGVQRIMLLR